MEIPIIVILLIGAVAIGLCVWVITLEFQLDQIENDAQRVNRVIARLEQQLDAAKRHAAFEQEKIMRRNHEKKS